MEPDIDPKNIVGSIIKGSRLLDLYTTDRRELSLGEFTRETGYNKTTTYRLLQTLVAVGWLVRSAKGDYRLGPRLLVLGAIARADLDLRNEALPFMQRLADEFGDTAFLMVPGQHGAVTIETCVGSNPVRVHGLAVGAVIPYHVAAGPVVLAAFSPELEAAALAGERRRFTPGSTTDEAALRAKFAEVRAQGYAFSTEDYIEDVCAVAAPVFGPDGCAVASLSVGGPANRFADGLRERAVARVVELAADLSARVNS
ncbi:IclR family transcriptional regulator [Nocardia sp. BMG111209]|uniref:IclR family transcriptional regulator n=1 Tax=Nocardia sp. BMG111209 TaxID=1160137 RepID=UPI00036418BE|nr:IclR family transcriptional regulator [Nocardia sp. BMG111209]